MRTRRGHGFTVRGRFASCIPDSIVHICNTSIQARIVSCRHRSREARSSAPFANDSLHHTPKSVSRQPAVITVTIILIFCTLLLGSAMLQCWIAAKRPGTNTKCLMSLLLLLGGVLISVCLHWIGQLSDTFTPLIRTATLIVYPIMLLASVAVSTLGRRELMADPKNASQGEDQAVYAAIFALIMLCAFCGSIAVDLSQRY
jgi:hypothetical protein